MTRVLVIDDEREIRTLLRLALESFGYEVREAENGEQGLKSCQEERPDVVLLDIFMPEKDGLETLRELRLINPDMRVIVMSGGGGQRNVGILRPAMLLGASRMLVKPFPLAQLQQIIAETLAAPPQTRPQQGA